MKTIVILALEGVFDSSLATTLNILTSAAHIHEHFCNGATTVNRRICGVKKGLLKTGEGLQLTIDQSIDDQHNADFVIVPGLGISHQEQLDHIINTQDGSKAIAFLKRMYSSGATLTASCSATFLLAEANVFNRQTATTSWWLSDTFRLKYPEIPLETDQMLVSGEQFICAGAAMAQADLMMAIVADIYGEKTAKLTADYLLIDRRKFQSQYIHSGMNIHKHPVIIEAERWVRENIENDFLIEDLASALYMSKRTLARRISEATGKTPIRFVQQIRLECAIYFLETSHYSFDTIANKVGYQDSSTLRRLIHKTTGKRPQQFRPIQ